MDARPTDPPVAALPDPRIVAAAADAAFRDRPLRYVRDAPTPTGAVEQGGEVVSYAQQIAVYEDEETGEETFVATGRVTIAINGDVTHGNAAHARGRLRRFADALKARGEALSQTFQLLADALG